MKKILIDCDPGVDDALALALAHGSPDLELVGVTSVGGNVPIEVTTDNALRLVDFLGSGAPVARGAGVPLVRPPRTASEVHGTSGLGGAVLPEPTTAPVGQHAVDLIIDTLAAAPGEISLVAVGPLTNIALALAKEPRVAEWAREFVLMGGSYTRGNNTPAAEFNIAADPEAAAAVFNAPWQPVMIGLDLTLQARATGEVRAGLAELGRLDAELITPSLDLYGTAEEYRDGGPPVHDVCAVAYAIDPGLLETAPAHVAVETQGRYTSGMTVVDFRDPDAGSAGQPPERHNAVVATGIDVARFWKLVTDAYARVAQQLP
ncbi:nucleoside hydrolase [Salinifilum aidingensis]